PPHHPHPPSLPTRRSSDLFKRATSATAQLTNETLDAYLQTDEQAHAQFNQIMMALGGSATKYDDPRDSFTELGAAESQAGSDYGDRKSTRLNSSHVSISYA